MARIRGSLLVALTVLASACSGDDAARDRDDVRFPYKVDTSLIPRVGAVPGRDGKARPVAAYADASGIVSDFVENELVVTPGSRAALDAFLARTGGIVISDDAVPAALALPGGKPLDEAAGPASYVVRLDPATVDLDDYRVAPDALGPSGALTFSSEAAAKLLAVATHARLTGFEAAPNFVLPPTALLHETKEWYVFGAGPNAFKWQEYTGRPVPNGNRSTVAAAWQFLTSYGYTPDSVTVAILDGGFFLDETGRPRWSHDYGPSLDKSYVPAQWDFAEGDPFAGGESLMKCAGGAACPWHGSRSAGAAVGGVNNGRAGAGSGGLVARPLLFRIDNTWAAIRAALKALPYAGARVANMSFGGSCNLDCQVWIATSGYAKVMSDLLEAGVVLVAAAGNDAKSVDDSRTIPCTMPGVVCVGALGVATNEAAAYTNFGNMVDVFAPTGIITMADPDSEGDPAIAHGTSAAAPFVAGVVAMMKAIRPSLTSPEVEQILHATSYRDDAASPSPQISGFGKGYLNALAALRVAAGDEVPSDAFEPNDTPLAAPLLPTGRELTCDRPGDVDHFRVEVPDYARATFTLENMASGLGELGLALVPAGGTPLPVGLALESGPRGRDVAVDLLAPGGYVLVVTCPTAQRYIPHASLLPVGLQPDAFEPNETPLAASDPPRGAGTATLHVPSDLDHYVLVVPPLPTGTLQSFAVTRSDRPVTLSLLDASGEVLETSSGLAPRVSRGQGQAGTYVVRVSGPVTRYVFERVQTVDGGAVAPALGLSGPIARLDPGGPVQGVLVASPTHWVVSADGRLRTVSLGGAGLHIDLLAPSGAVVAAGAPSSTGPGEQLTIPALATGLHVLRITGTPDDRPYTLALAP